MYAYYFAIAAFDASKKKVMTFQKSIDSHACICLSSTLQQKEDDDADDIGEADGGVSHRDTENNVRAGRMNQIHTSVNKMNKRDTSLVSSKETSVAHHQKVKKDRPRLFLAGPSSGPSPEDAASSAGNPHHRSSIEATLDGRADNLASQEVPEVTPILIEDNKMVDDIGDPDADRRSGINNSLKKKSGI